jgi:tetratricopeptide (TPR) repeat protein
VDAARALVRAGKLAEASTLLLDASDDSAAQLLLSQVFQRMGDFDGMLAAVQRALSLDDSNWENRFRFLECHLYCGRADVVRARLLAFEADAEERHAILARLAEFHVHCLDHAGALRCLDAALHLSPGNANYLFSRAASELALGELEHAENSLNRVIELRPADYDAWRNRSTLRRRTPEDNTITGIEAQLRKVQPGTAGEAQLYYALAKELEDIGEYADSFTALKRGADVRRGLLSYRVEHDLEVMQELRKTFTVEQCAGNKSAFREFGPVFVLGLPRSGTTLIDRILSSHPRVASLGEVNDFAYSLMHVLGSTGSKTELVRQSAQMDFGRLGRRYWEGLRNYGVDAPMLIDKTPLNYLYIGLLRLALPEARVIHVRRAPMDSCYGMYRTLFRAGYPFSYDLDDLARYYIEWQLLMNHWSNLCGDWLHEVRYEALVDDQEGETRRLLQYCDLEWNDACLRYHENSSAVATASAAQVRQPVYRDALQRWRRYEQQLQPLADRLTAAGIDIGRND